MPASGPFIGPQHVPYPMGAPTVGAPTSQVEAWLPGPAPRRTAAPPIAAVTVANAAGDVINAVRDMIPDPVYTAAGVPQPDSNGTLFRASTLYRFLDRAVKVTADRIGWTVVDWYAFPARTGQPWYALDAKWVSVEYAWANQFGLNYLNEPYTIYPGAASTSQPLSFHQHRGVDHLEIGFFPPPNYTDGVSQLTADVGLATDPMPIQDTTGFLPRGYAQLESELVAYRALTTNPVGLGTLSRGQGGTATAPHPIGTFVFELSLWVKGRRSPQAITSSTSSIELPLQFNHALELYVLSRCRQSENDDQSAQGYIKQYNEEVERIAGDPSWRRVQVQVAPYGEDSAPAAIYGLVVP